MSRILISGLVNTETTVRVREFPIPYYPVDYPFFGVRTHVSGVGYNLALALSTLGDEAKLLSMTARDFGAEYIGSELKKAGIATEGILPLLRETPSSAVLYDGTGRRQIHCDLKDMQETAYPFPEDVCRGADLVVATNTNFSRPLLRLAREAGVPIATDVHVLGDIHDDYNRDFMASADILFLSDEGIGEDFGGFLWALKESYGPKIIVLGRGHKGAAIYLREQNDIFTLPAVNLGPVVNTVGAGDALFSAFVHFYARGASPMDALNAAQHFAAAKIRVSGAGRGFVTEAELEALMK